MKKDKLKGFICGIVMSTLVFSTALVGFAATGSQSITATFSNIKLYVNQKLVTPKDANGNTVEPFLYNGTTYLPVRAVGEALAQEVSWDNTEKAVYIGTQKTTTEVTTPKTETTSDKVLMDKNGIKVTYKGIAKSTSYSGGYVIKLNIENSTSKNYTVQARNLSINGIMCDHVFSSDISAGKTAMDEISISKSSMDKIGQTTIDKAEFNLTIFSSDDWSDSFDSDTFKI